MGSPANQGGGKEDRPDPPRDVQAQHDEQGENGAVRSGIDGHQPSIVERQVDGTIGAKRQRNDGKPVQQPRQRLLPIQWNDEGQVHCPPSYTRRKASVPLVPPKPKLFLMAYSMGRSRAALAQ